MNNMRQDKSIMSSAHQFLGMAIRIPGTRRVLDPTGTGMIFYLRVAPDLN
jgi:hypothetical protein